ncbi:hypothetical protein DEU56DRAFT_787301 [Suillus clintonianus]|uniref:uncharacterized protein n=1 Tax=Suillus clintonianus TaxID=1904413 RepID=UPI001B87866C|nr:uncharacterized protein DEU56DRAFT_787301 [Suillus clintonianus]KAG2146285.1 hypothetical protein DEU56DRAFT_787301 [Suillus clintonianus]
MPFCPLCPPDTQVNEVTLTIFACKHIKGKHKTGLRCELCQQDFKANAALIQHLASKKHHKCKAPKCSLTFMTPTELSKHTKLHHNVDPPASTSTSKGKTPITVFPCTSCGKAFGGPTALQNHVSVDHAPKLQYPCQCCYQSFSSSGALGAHRSVSHPLAVQAVPKVQASACFKCSMCQKTCPSVDELSCHIRDIHPLDGPAKKVYPCASCDRTFSKMSKLTAHSDTAHPPGPVCAICWHKCLSQHDLDDHVAAVHTRAVCNCKGCDMVFASEEGLRHHYLQSSTDAHPKCVECGLGFENDAAYATHRQTSHPEPPRPVTPSPSYPCSMCDKVFKLPLALDDHMTATHVFTCGICEFACPEEELLQEHIASAHSCPVCHEGVFANPDLLNEHLADHATPYRCEVCQTRYAEEEGLRQHYRDSPNDIHPSCTRCDLDFQDADDYHNHTETVHPQVSCQLCDGALFDPEELPIHYSTSRNHPVCDKCQVGFSDRGEFAMHGATEHPESYCHLCQWQFQCPESLQNHIRHFVAHPKCMDCELRFADADAYQHHLFVVHRPHCSEPETRRDFDPDPLDNGDGVVHSEQRFSNSFSPDRVDSTWGFSVNYDFPYAPSIPLPPSTSGYSSPLSQRVLTRSSVGSRSSSRTLSPPPICGIKVAHLENGHTVDQSGSPEFEHSPLSNIPTVGTPLISSTDFRSPFSPRPDTPALFAPQELNGASHSDQESIASATSSETRSPVRSPETSSPVIKLPENDVSPVSSSGWSTLSGENVSRMSTKSEDSLSQRPAGLAVPMLRLQVPVPNGTSQTVSISGTPSSISPESADIDISANVTPDYLREARAYLAVTHPEQAPSAVNNVHSPALVSPTLTSIGLTASSRERRREVRFEDSIMSEPLWENQSSDSTDSSFDPPVLQSRRKYGVQKKSGASKLPRFAPLRPGRVTGRNGIIHPANGTSSLSPYHCRICRRETCEDLTTTTCGHLFCNACITDAVIRDSRCPVCRNAVLLYCLFRIDTTCHD